MYRIRTPPPLRHLFMGEVSDKCNSFKPDNLAPVLVPRTQRDNVHRPMNIVCTLIHLKYLSDPSGRVNVRANQQAEKIPHPCPFIIYIIIITRF